MEVDSTKYNFSDLLGVNSKLFEFSKLKSDCLHRNVARPPLRTVVVAIRHYALEGILIMFL